MDQMFDLLGDPISEDRDPRGRPVHQPTEKKRSVVLACVATDYTHAEIAAAIGVDGKTLRKYYSRELKGGKSMLRAVALVKLQEQVDKGNVSAIRLAFQVYDRADMARSAENDRAKERMPRLPKLGKKEVARDEALRAHEESEWGSDLAPLTTRTVN